jgi:hypothetical protein
MSTHITIDNGRINAMRTDPAWAAAFPFIMNGSIKKGCCGNRDGAVIPDYEGIKHNFTTMPVDKKATLKTMLSADKVMVYINRAGTVVEVEII